MVSKIKLGVNIDHIATLRQARLEFEPDPIEAALIAEQAGADSIVAHLREDRRHIQDKDIIRLKKELTKPLNLEMSTSKSIVDLACRVHPHQITLVPEKRQEVTTEGGLDVIKNFNKLKRVVKLCHQENILVSLFIDPKINQVKASADLGVTAVEIHTGTYANAKTRAATKIQLDKLKKSSRAAYDLGLNVYAGHGLNYTNLGPVAKIPEQEEFNIGHAIVSYAVFHGFKKAVRDIKRLMNEARQ